jgi:hypothetical protein
MAATVEVELCDTWLLRSGYLSIDLIGEICQKVRE